MNRRTRRDPVKAAPTRTLYRVFERLARTPAGSPYCPTPSPEERLIVMLDLGAELQRRGFHDAGRAFYLSGAA